MAGKVGRGRYEDMTNEDFDRLLQEIVGGMTTAAILSYPDVHEALSEALNNDVLDAWDEEQDEEDDEDEDDDDEDDDE